MCGKTILWFTSFWVLATGVGYSQVVPPSQWFQITSGRYLECCGFGGTRMVSLPNDRQSFIKLEFGAAREAVAMTVLGRRSAECLQRRTLSSGRSDPI